MNAEITPAWKLALRNAVEREHAAEAIKLLADTLAALENMTTESFKCGGDKPQREAISALLAKIEAEVKAADGS